MGRSAALTTHDHRPTMSTAEIQDAVRDALSEQLPRIRRIEHDRLAYTADLTERCSRFY